MLYVLRSLGRARSLVLGIGSGPSKSSRVDCLDNNSVVASVQQLSVQTITKRMLYTNGILMWLNSERADWPSKIPMET